jgi:hypothetical protein
MTSKVVNMNGISKFLGFLLQKILNSQKILLLKIFGRNQSDLEEESFV